MQKVKVTALMRNAKNPRTLDKDKFEKLKQSLKEFPEMLDKRPIIVANGIILGGNMRYKAAVELGFKEVPVIDASDWTEEQRQQFIIKDNLSFGNWDWDILANEWEVNKLEDWGMDLPIVNERLEAIKDGQPEITVTEEILEEHNYIVFTFDNQLDWQVAKELFDIGTVAKPGFTETYMQKGIGRVRKGIELLEKFNKR